MSKIESSVWESQRMESLIPLRREAAIFFASQLRESLSQLQSIDSGQGLSENATGNMKIRQSGLQYRVFTLFATNDFVT